MPEKNNSHFAQGAKEKNESDILRSKQAMELLMISRPTLQRWIREEVIPFFRVGGTLYFRKSELMRFFNRDGEK